jgi:hypothetical protein
MERLVLSEARAMLERTPRVLEAWLSGVPDAWARATEGPDTWSPYDVVGHLVDGERTDWIPRVRRILELGTSQPFDPFSRGLHLERRDETLALRLVQFSSLRRGNLQALEHLNLGPQHLPLRGLHSELGEVTLEQLLATWVAHDLDHVFQIARVMALRYRETAGPWVQYLRVLRSGVEQASQA